jgi:uncharacterized alkaline shock family protein YloU
MSSRHRKEQSGFDLQPGTVATNGSRPAAGERESGVAGQAASTAESSVPRTPVTNPGETPAGKIEVSPRAIAHLASRAAQRSYGVVGLAQRHARPGWAELLRREEAHKGVDVSFTDGRVVIELYLVLEYGTRISEVARNIMSNVKFTVESALGVPVVQVNVNVQDIRVSEEGT